MPTYNIQQNPYYQIPVARNWLFDRLVSAAQAPSAPTEGPYGKKVGVLRSLLGDETNRMNMADKLRARDIELARRPFEAESAFERERQGISERGLGERQGAALRSAEGIAAAGRDLQRTLTEAARAQQGQQFRDTLAHNVSEAALNRGAAVEQQLRAGRIGEAQQLLQGEQARGLAYPRVQTDAFGNTTTTYPGYQGSAVTTRNLEGGINITRPPQLNPEDAGEISKARTADTEEAHVEPEEGPAAPTEQKQRPRYQPAKKITQVQTPEYQGAPTQQFVPTTPAPEPTTPAPQPDQFEQFKAFRQQTPMQSMYNPMQNTLGFRLGNIQPTVPLTEEEKAPSESMKKEMELLQQLLGAKNITY